MFEIASNFAAARDSVTWAETALAEFKEETRKFFEFANVKIVNGVDAVAGENIQKAVLTHDLPKNLTRKATEVLNNARHSLDQATYAAQKAMSASVKKKIHFPWAESLDDLNRRLAREGYSQKLWDTFRSFDPYPFSVEANRGSDLIRAMSKMANNKHTVGLSIGADVATIRFPNISGLGLSSLRVMTPRWDSVKNEAILLRWRGLGTLEVSGNYNFTFVLNFSDKVFQRPEPTGPALAEFVAYSRMVTERLQSECLDSHGR